MWSWLLGLSSVAVYWMLGSKHRAGWLAGIASEAGWAAYSVLYRQWGFLACAFLFAAVYWRNWVKWGRDRRLMPPGTGDGGHRL